jgi:cell division protein FtsB
MKRNQWLALALGVLLFVCGLMAGVLGDRYLSMLKVNAKTAEDFRHQYTHEMRTRLKLTPAQVRELDVILDETKAKYKAVRDRYRPEMVKIKDEQIERVKSILTPEQKPEYDRLVAEREQRFHEQEERDRKADEKSAAEHRAAAGQK